MRAENDLGVDGAAAADDFTEVVLEIGDGCAHEVVHAEHDGDKMRLLSEDVALQALQAAGGGVAADAGIAHGDLGLWMNFLQGDVQHLRIGAQAATMIIDAGDAIADADDADGFFACREELRGFQGSGSEQANAGEKDQENAHETGKATTRLHG